jgi:hypothetical protein
MAKLKGGLFEKMIAKARDVASQLTDTRKDCNAKRCDVGAAGMAGLGIFMTQSPSFLQFQRKFEANKGRSNYKTMFCGDPLPSDAQIRNLLDVPHPSELNAMFDLGLQALEESGGLEKFRTPEGYFLAAIDGTEYHCSDKIRCDCCNQREQKVKKNGKIETKTNYCHSVLAAALVVPGFNQALPLVPEFLAPQDGHDKQDCENAAVKRWIEGNAERYRRLNLVLLGDDLMSREPVCRAVVESKMHFIFVCKPESHKTLYEYVKTGAEEKTVRAKRKGKSVLVNYKFMEAVPIREGRDSMPVNWMQIVETDEKTGKRIYSNAFVADLEITQENVENLCAYGRARWKIENENNNTLKTKGYRFEHNFGHGKKNLAAMFAALAIESPSFSTPSWISPTNSTKPRKTNPERGKNSFKT